MKPFCLLPNGLLVLTLTLAAPLARAQRAAVVVASLNPAPNALAVSRTTMLEVPFTRAMSAPWAGSITLFSQQYRGLRSTLAALRTTPAGSTAMLTPTAPAGQSAAFRPGETIWVSVPAAIQTLDFSSTIPYMYQFTAAVGGGAGTFGPGSDVPAGGNAAAIALAVGDVDGDSDLDLLTTSYLTNEVTIRLNNGSGTFAAGTAVAVGPSPVGVVLADVDGDGDLDILTASTADNTVSERLNNGGVFSGNQRIGVGTRPHGLVVGDVDADGDLDLLTANNVGNTVSVRLNNYGSYAPSAGAEVAVGSGAYSVAVGDLDSDGDLDLLCANNTANTVSVRLNNGTGIFSGTTDIAVGSSPESVVVGDVDADGDLDFITANASGNSVSVRLNTGNGTFAGTTDLGMGAGSNPESVVLGDVDGDGDLDLLVATQNNTVSVRLNNGQGTFTSNGDVSVGNKPMALAMGDLDQDGDLDFVAANQLGNSASVRLNSPLGPLATGTATSVAQVTLYPNPATPAADVWVALPVATGTLNARAVVVNVLGEVVAEVWLAAQSGRATGIIPTAGLAAGIYIVQLQAGPAVICKRLELR